MVHEKRVLLDTCAVLWLASGHKALSSAARSAIEHSSMAFVSAISAWELSLRADRGQLELPLPAAQWIQEVLKHHRLTSVPLDVDILVAANQLPWHHRDPADRFIIATARREKAAVITRDKRFAAYDVRIIS